ncbi:MAG TPA: sigma factor, partial [Ktedonobacteraceae bacterium]|nr:sigma factor [Ktedonobacteraceae bacterium]
MDTPNDLNHINGRVTQLFNEQSDEALIHAIAGGAVWAMEPLYQRYSRILYSLAYRMVADHQVAEDLIQD